MILHEKIMEKWVRELKCIDYVYESEEDHRGT